jgi:hypothetical protein
MVHRAPMALAPLVNAHPSVAADARFVLGSAV